MNTHSVTRPPFDIGYFIRSFLVLILFFIVFVILWFIFAASTHIIVGSLIVLCLPLWFVAIDIYFHPKNLLAYAPETPALPEPKLVPCLDILFRYWRPKFYQGFMDKYQEKLFNKCYEEAFYAATHDTFTTDHLLSMLRVRPDARTEVLNVLESLLKHTNAILKQLKKELSEQEKIPSAINCAIIAIENTGENPDKVKILEDLLIPFENKRDATYEGAETQIERLKNIQKAIQNAQTGDMADTEAYIEGLFPDNYSF